MLKIAMLKDVFSSYHSMINETKCICNAVYIGSSKQAVDLIFDHHVQNKSLKGEFENLYTLVKTPALLIAEKVRNNQIRAMYQIFYSVVRKVHSDFEL